MSGCLSERYNRKIQSCRICETKGSLRTCPRTLNYSCLPVILPAGRSTGLSGSICHDRFHQQNIRLVLQLCRGLVEPHFVLGVHRRAGGLSGCGLDDAPKAYQRLFLTACRFGVRLE